VLVEMPELGMLVILEMREQQEMVEQEEMVVVAVPEVMRLPMQRQEELVELLEEIQELLVDLDLEVLVVMVAVLEGGRVALAAPADLFHLVQP
jgi:hypothetical protein